MSLLSRLFSKKLKCARCRRELTRLSKKHIDKSHPFYDLVEQGIMKFVSEHTAYQCSNSKCKRILCSAHTKKEMWSTVYGVDRCSFCGAPANPLE
jgi:hypothetical protein